MSKLITIYTYEKPPVNDKDFKYNDISALLASEDVSCTQSCTGGACTGVCDFSCTSSCTSSCTRSCTSSCTSGCTSSCTSCTSCTSTCQRSCQCSREGGQCTCSNQGGQCRACQSACMTTCQNNQNLTYYIGNLNLNTHENDLIEDTLYTNLSSYMNRAIKECRLSNSDVFDTTLDLNTKLSASLFNNMRNWASKIESTYSINNVISATPHVTEVKYSNSVGALENYLNRGKIPNNIPCCESSYSGYQSCITRQTN